MSKKSWEKHQPTVRARASLAAFWAEFSENFEK
jgi:hypothetical protein